ncbi:PRK06851 family protein [Jeotgalibacillus sp. ET6]|uniref:PRK06851 family protein n=1 Tax=Jeotgalibacillus sp. ET6 TaxID=3037260 RepID=UPI00241844EE|nr:PRK06851 family protein [Jeotgalibacillus sp. ET6]MDG5472808.1 PRK06851 family protein [Jeotgalibacillus sp. ET6]
MTGKIRHYFAGGNTAKGFHHFFDSNFASLNRLWILKGGPGTGKSTLMKQIGHMWLEKGYDVEWIHCSSDPDSLDGVIIPSLKVGLVDGTAPHIVEPTAPGAKEEYVNLGEAWERKKLVQHLEEVEQYNRKIDECYKEAYSSFAEALLIHDEWEDIYIGNLDRKAANQLSQSYIDDLFSDVSLNKKAEVKHRFLGAATFKGAVDYVPNLTYGLTKRYFIKGRPGTGKSTFLKKVAKKAENLGLDVEIYHCGFDPESLDMVIVRELGFAIFDSTAPHEYFPERDGDEIIDTYDKMIRKGTDEEYELIIQEIRKRYTDKMKEGTASLKRAKYLHDELESIYIQAMNFEQVEKIQQSIHEQICEIAQTQ